MASAVPPCEFGGFECPLERIRSDHDHQLLFGQRLIELAMDLRLEPVLEEAQSIAGFLTWDLPLHGQDEEHDLLPLLGARCHLTDGFGPILRQLEFEHSAEKVLARHIVVDLDEISGGGSPEYPLRIFADLRAFADAQQRHVTWENRVVLPLAKKRLRPDDLQAMACNMATRRGTFRARRARRFGPRRALSRLPVPVAGSRRWSGPDGHASMAIKKVDRRLL